MNIALSSASKIPYDRFIHLVNAASNLSMLGRDVELNSSEMATLESFYPDGFRDSWTFASQRTLVSYIIEVGEVVMDTTGEKKLSVEFHGQKTPYDLDNEIGQQRVQFAMNLKESSISIKQKEALSKWCTWLDTQLSVLNMATDAVRELTTTSATQAPAQPPRNPVFERVKRDAWFDSHAKTRRRHSAE